MLGWLVEILQAKRFGMSEKSDDGLAVVLLNI